MNKYHYRAFGITISSEFELPDLSKEEFGTWDLEIKIGEVPRHLNKPTRIGAHFELAPNDFLFWHKSAGYFRAQFGTLITVCPESEINQEVRLFLLGTIIGAILFQRGALPMHGSSFLTKNGAIIIAGNSGVGKSSVVAYMSQKQYPMISDDISVIEVTTKDGLCLHSGIQSLKLWKDVLEYMGSQVVFNKIRSSIEKYRVPIASNIITGPYSISKILVLTSKHRHGFNLERITGTDKFQLLKGQVYRTQFFDSIGSIQRNFDNLATLANSVEVFKVERPSSPLLIKELALFIEEEIL